MDHDSLNTAQVIVMEISRCLNAMATALVPLIATCMLARSLATVSTLLHSPITNHPAARVYTRS